jgi:hypothetical protein
MTILILENVIPDPKTPKFINNVQYMIEIIKYINENKKQLHSTVTKLIISLIIIYSRFNSIRNKLENITVWQNNGINVLLRVAKFVEDQFYFAEQVIDNTTKEKGYYDADWIINDDKETIWGGTKSNVAAGIEEHCENFQLIYAYILEKYKGNLFNGEIDLISPYNDAEFSKFVSCAAIWRRIIHLFENVIYLQWHYSRHPDDKDVYIFLPNDKAELQRSEVASLRRLEIQYELGGSIAYDEEIEIDKIIDKISTQINPPNLGEYWDGVIDINQLILIFPYSIDISLVNREVSRLHYENIMEEIIINREDNYHITWNEYLQSISLLRIINRNL